MEKDLILSNLQLFSIMIECELTIIGYFQFFLKRFRNDILKFYTPEFVAGLFSHTLYEEEIIGILTTGKGRISYEIDGNDYSEDDEDYLELEDM